VELSDNVIYGESEIPDCPADGSFCKPYDKYGITMASPSYSGKTPIVTSTSALPLIKIKSLPIWGGRYLLNRN